MGILVTPTMDMSNFDTTVPHQSESNHALLRAAPSTGGSASTVRCRMRQTGITAITDLFNQTMHLDEYQERDCLLFCTIIIFTNIK